MEETPTDVKTDDFESRDYQTELFELALQKNLILYLPTGSGKTFIAILLLKELCNTPLISLPITHGGKRGFFLVNTVALVEQQANHIQHQSPFTVGKFSGDMGVDLWDQETWHDQLNLHQIFVMTCQIFVNLIESHVISLQNVVLVIFDECHRAVSNHPMRQAMKNFNGVPDSKQPRVLGLTATLLNGNIKAKDVEKEIRELENTFMSRIATSQNEEMVQSYSTNPREKKLTHRENETSSICYQIRNRVLNVVKVLLDNVEIDQVVKSVIKPADSHQIDFNAKKTNKRLKNLVEDVQVNMDDLGVYGGSLAVLAHLVQLQQLLPNAQEETAAQLFKVILANCVYLRKRMEDEMNRYSLSPVEILYRFSSDKVHKLFFILKKLKGNDSAIIFVKRRFSAKILYYLLKRASKLDPSLKHVKSNFIVGYNIGNPFKDTRENYIQRVQNKRVMMQFNQGELNVLFASNVVEEGIDVQQCNYVIMFDPPQDFRAYIQSKGRARDKDSNYIIMIPSSDTKFLSKYEGYCQVEKQLKEVLYGGKSSLRNCPPQDEIDAKLFAEKPGLESYRPRGLNGPVITALSAISQINRYFVSLKHDKFTKITPSWFLARKELQYKCSLRLPMESKVKGFVEGSWQMSQEDAKRAVALQACIKLHQCGELDDRNLLPISWDSPMVKDIQFTPNKDDSEIFEEYVGEKKVKCGVRKNKRSCLKKWPECLCKCRPQPGKPAFLHILDMRPIYTPPQDSHRLLNVHQTLSEPVTFALLSAKKLPPLAPFPLYMSVGELEANVMDPQKVEFDQKQLKRLTDFHCQIFDQVLAVAKSFMVRDLSNSQNSYLIVPVLKDQSQNVRIDWDAIDGMRRPFPSTDVKPTREERSQIRVTDENYLGKVVSPWYRDVPAQKYLVTKVCYEMSENTTFPTSTYATYKEYFEDKYKIEPVIANQPLLEVRAFSSRLNCIKPRALTKQLKRKKDENEEFEVWLMPEYCVVYPLDGRYWLKALLLPSVLHRISRLSQAEELRRVIIQETKVGLVDVPSGSRWKKLEEEESLIRNEPVSEKQQALTPLPIMSKNSTSARSTQLVWGNEEEPLDIERNMDTASLFDILNYSNFIGKPLLGLNSENENLTDLNKLTNTEVDVVLQFVEPPPLQMLQNNAAGLGPQQVEVMQALATANANDFVSCERLETLGDSFLKYAISLVLFETQDDMMEGHLTQLKGEIVGNKNLYFCGKKKNLGALLEVHDFSPNDEWVAPGFCVEHSVQNVLRSAKLNPNCLYNVQIPEEERVSGVLSEATNSLLSDIMFAAEDSPSAQNCPFINQLSLTDKNISDAVEAILGVYIKSNGIMGGLALMNWFGVTNPKLATKEVFTRPAKSVAQGTGDPARLLFQAHKLEKTLHYHFRDKAFLLQALTHSSYTKNHITSCYQRLEFLGDAIIDFLITVHIFEKCKSLSPGDLTDLRSALVNNITLGALSVRYHFHKYVLQCSNKLQECMMRFVKHQEDRDHLIDNDILFLSEERDVNIAEAVDVPKALGDVFEALIAAVYLDSGKDLNVTWKVVYNLMKEEIEKFHKDVPKNHVRMLYESGCAPNFESQVATDGAVMVTVEVFLKSSTAKFNGFGDNKLQAKRAASKHALRAIRSASFNSASSVP